MSYNLNLVHGDVLSSVTFHAYTIQKDYFWQDLRNKGIF